MNNNLPRAGLGSLFYFVALMPAVLTVVPLSAASPNPIASPAITPIPGRPWTETIPDPDTYEWRPVKSRPGYRFRGMYPIQQRFYNYIQAKRKAGKPLSFVDRAMIRWLQSKRRWPEAPVPNDISKAYMRYLRKLGRRELNFAERLMLSQLIARGYLPVDQKPSDVQRRLIQYLNSGPPRPQNWFERTFGRVEPLLDEWTAASGYDMTGGGGGTGGTVFPAQRFNGMQITCNVSGAALGPPGDKPGFATTRSYEGAITGKTLSISGAVSITSGYGASVTVLVQAGAKSARDSKEIKRGESWSFSLSVPVEPGTESGSFYVKMDGHYSMGGGWRGLGVYGELTRAEGAREKAWAQWQEHVDKLLKTLGYEETPEGKAVRELREAASGTDEQWKAYVDRHQKELGYTDSSEDTACREMFEALREPDKWQQYARDQGVEANVGTPETPASHAAPARSDSADSPNSHTTDVGRDGGARQASTAAPDVGSIRVGTDARGGQLAGAGEIFHSPKRLATVVTYEDLADGTELVAIWVRDGVEFKRSAQKASGSGWASFAVYLEDGVFPPGTYTVTILAGEKVLARKTFRVEK